ncbi:hypothetical protein Sme01_36170 [Sphaerisporangium melleum]|uniref:Uncharacterized protein n=1 Tax=Sphaerisporangium melleum TaxID=321316 RepID=A0A917RQK3_9ACTN|nr:hypothetical protein [Sphaerisporangium melleum]GGL19075.1 hypothetical protein GCM10007964_71350 [Sphaerisporangium melleum]GII71141.1 hypothetical protein Sme01_36170 [Sphaerisporangium melleum]
MGRGQEPAEIRQRYGPDDLVAATIAKATPCILSAVRSIEGRLAFSRCTARRYR